MRPYGLIPGLILIILQLFLFWWWLLECVYTLSWLRTGAAILSKAECYWWLITGNPQRLSITDGISHCPYQGHPHMRTGRCVRWSSEVCLPPIWESCMTIRVSEGFSHSFPCDCLTAQILPLSSLMFPPELVQEYFPVLFLCFNLHLRLWLPRTKPVTLVSRVVWERRSSNESFGAEAHISRVTMRMSSLVWCGSEIGPGIREQDNFKTSFLDELRCYCKKINALAGT